MKKLYLNIILCFFMMLFIGCSDKNISDVDAYEITKLEYPKIIDNESSFNIVVECKNISGKVLQNTTCSSFYKIGVKISVYTELDGEKYFLQDDFEMVTDDELIEKIQKNEIVGHTWTFYCYLDSATHGTDYVDGQLIKKQAPKGRYTISASNGVKIDNAFEIV